MPVKLFWSIVLLIVVYLTSEFGLTMAFNAIRRKRRTKQDDADRNKAMDDAIRFVREMEKVKAEMRAIDPAGKPEGPLNN